MLMQPATAFAGANALSPTKTQPAHGSEAATPAWIAFDRKVLRFNCHFDEEVHESQAEASRVRKCILHLSFALLLRCPLCLPSVV